MKNLNNNSQTGFCFKSAGVVLSAIALFYGADASAVGFRDINQDPEAIARGGAFVATADNPSAIYYNPAGITQLEGNNLRGGIYTISANTSYHNSSGGSAHTDTALQPVPHAYYVYAPKDFPLAFGIGAYAPYGLSLNWGKHTPFTSLAEDGQVLYACVNPVVAWRICSQLSIGIGPTLNYSQATLNRGIFGVPGGQFRFEGDGFDAGFNAGARWQPIEQLAFGVNYRSATTINYSGTSRTPPSPPLPGPSSTQVSGNFPQFVTGGVSYRPTENWNLEVNIDWTDWSVLKQFVFRGTAFGNVPFPLEYQDSFLYEFGATRQLGKGYFASVGYIFSENSSPSAHYNPIVPDGDLQLGSVGFGHHGKHWDWAAAYHFGYGQRNVAGNISSTPETADGHYHSFNNAFDLAATFKF